VGALGHRLGPHAKLTEVADLRQRITGLTRAGWALGRSPSPLPRPRSPRSIISTSSP